MAAKEKAWPGLAASAVSTIVSRGMTYPFDTIKSRLQIQGALGSKQKIYRSTLHAFQTMLLSEGFLGFYRGFVPVLAGVLPATMIYFSAYEAGKRSVPPRYGAAGDLAVGAFAQLTAGFVFTPVDIIKERMQVQKLTGMADTDAVLAVRSLLRKDGPSGLLRGYWITNSVWIPWTALYVALYEGSKRNVARRLQLTESKDLPVWALAACSGGSAAAAALLTHPIDVVKTQLQVLSGNPDLGRLTAWRVTSSIYSREGMPGFLQGCSARMLQIAPGAVISWLLYEDVKRRLQ